MKFPENIYVLRYGEQKEHNFPAKWCCHRNTMAVATTVLHTLFIWTENFRQRKPPGTSKVFLTLLNQTGFAQNFFLSIEHPPVAPSTIVPNPRSKKWSKWKMNTTFTLKTFKIMKLSCLVKKIFSLKKNRTLVFVFFHICNHNPKNRKHCQRASLRSASELAKSRTHVAGCQFYELSYEKLD